MGVAAKLMRPLGVLFFVPIILSTAFFLYPLIDSLYVLRYCWFYWVFMILGPFLLCWAIPNLAYLLLAIRYLTKFNKGKVKSNVTGVKSPYASDKIVKRILIVVVFVVLLTLSFLLVALTAVVGWHSNNLKAVRSGTFQFLSGVKGTRVVIDRNADQVPRISVTDEGFKADIAYGQAWTHMIDRQYQIDLYHRIATGRLSTLVGERGLKSDMFMRTLNFKKHAEDIVKSGHLSSVAMQWLDSYAAGINAYIQEKKNMIPWEMWIHGHKFNDGNDWTAADSLAVLKLWQWSLSSNYVQELNRLRLLVEKKLSYDRVVELDGGYLNPKLNEDGLASLTLSALGVRGDVEIEKNIEDEDAIIEAEKQFWTTYLKDKLNIKSETSVHTKADAFESVEDLPSDVETIEETIEQHIDPSTSFFGSVFKKFGWSWISGSTTDGLVVNVSELDGRLTMPNQMYLCHLRIQGPEGIDTEVTGTSMPGFPGIVMGRTGTFSWSLIPSNADNTDVFILKEVQADVSYDNDGSTSQYERREEVIEVSGRSQPVSFVVLDSIHGPVLNNSFIPFEMTPGFSLALKWAPHHLVDLDNEKKHDHTIEVFTDIWTMANPSLDYVGRVFEDKFDAPPVGVFYADGEIAYNSAFFYVGAVPIRKHTGMFPVDGSSNQFRWPQVLSSDFPKFNPGRTVPLVDSFYFSAANRLSPRGFKFLYGYDFDDDFYVRSLRDVLQNHLLDRTANDMTFIKDTFTDKTNGMWHNSDSKKFHFKHLLESIPEDRFLTASAKERRETLLTKWNGVDSGSNAGLFQGWWYELSRLTIRATGVKYWNRPSSILSILLANTDTICVDMVEGNPTTKDCYQFAAQAFERAVRKHGNMNWGDSVPSVKIDHDLFNGGNFYACACSRSMSSQDGNGHAFPTSGPSTGFVSHHGPVYRQIQDYNTYSNMKMIANGGPSGNQWEKGLYDEYIGKFSATESVNAGLGGAFVRSGGVITLSRGT